ncbi:MAG TPA: YbaB/EbfC family nucleoid-associated protein [Nocardia sp.]|uniref:YbaB/EbfC family nucleoid-associated protein n=1 Tax=Nocardia sp. TaxID=1821 RepID=UPI002B4B5EE9|nr:YbaB/EbfC family nucleoid-associated protein [Nocardia sp.]HLS77043.1 YbaB/EbfC family nucleoid-associated protein [Nocardia sp.]
MLGNDPQQAAADMAKWAEQLERTAQRYQELHGRMTAISVTERSADGRIAVTVNADGATTGIELTPAVKGMDPAAVAAELMACTRRAQAGLRGQVTALVHDMVGEDAAGQAIVAQYAERFPDLEPGEAEPGPEPAPEPQACTPPAAPTPPPARAADREQTVTPDEPDPDDLYYRRRSWLD